METFKETSLSAQGAADYLGINPATLLNWRTRGVGPAYIALGGAIRYRQSDLDAWIESRRVVPGQAPAAADRAHPHLDHFHPLNNAAREKSSV